MSTNRIAEKEIDEAPSPIIVALNAMRRTDLSILGAVMVILGMAAVMWLSHYFVPLDRYERDQTELKQTVREIATDVKTLIKESRK